MTSAGLNTSKDYALCYHDMGFSVFVLQNPGSEGRTIEQLKARKWPAVDWKLYQIMRASKIQIERWYTKNPLYNLAAATGDISKIVALDVDEEKGKKRIEEKRMEMSTNLRVALENTMVNKTGSGGLHIIFRMKEPIDIGNKVLWQDSEDTEAEIRLKANGGYIVMAPSHHPNDKHYEWNGRTPCLVTRKEFEELIRLLSHLPGQSDKIEPVRTRTNTDLLLQGITEDRTLTPQKMQELLYWLREYRIQEGTNKVIYTPGSRNDIIFFLSGTMLLTGFSHETTRAFVTLLCNSSGYPDEDLNKSLDVVDNTYEKHIEQVKGKSGLHDIIVTNHAVSVSTDEYLKRSEVYARICQIINPEPVVQPQQQQKQQLREQLGDEDKDDDEDDDISYPEDDFDTNSDNNTQQQQIILDNRPGAWLRRQKKADKFLDVNDALVKEILRRYKYRTFIDTKEIVCENGGVFVKGGEEHINSVLEELGGSKIKNARRNEIIQRIKIMTYTEREEFEKNPLFVNVKNGIVNLVTGERFPHDPDNYPSLIQIPHNYYTPAEMKERLAARPKGSQVLCKKILFEYLCDVLEPQDIILSMEFWGYDLIGDNRFQKALMAIGPPDSGKSTHVDITEAFLGKQNCANKTLKELTVNRFAKADLYHKLANTCADISNSKLEDIETFKMLVSGDDISAEKKNKDPFSYIPRCKLHFSANTPPLPKNEVDEAFYKRWILLLFAMKKKQFLDKAKDVVINRNLLQQIKQDENGLSDLLYLAVQAAGKILRQDGFSGGARSRDINTIMEEYTRKARPTIAWIEDNCVIGREYEGDKYRLFEDFKDYCKKHRLPSINSLIGFARELTGLYHVEDAQRGGRKQKRRNVWVGISLIKDLRPEQQTEILGEDKYE